MTCGRSSRLLDESILNFARPIRPAQRTDTKQYAEDRLYGKNGVNRLAICIISPHFGRFSFHIRIFEFIYCTLRKRHLYALRGQADDLLAAGKRTKKIKKPETLNQSLKWLNRI